jgi:signal transduction histidine kinase
VFLPYASRRTKVASTRSLIRSSLARGARCIWCEDKRDPKLVDELGDGGLAIERAMVDASRLAGWIAEMTDETSRAGYDGLLVVRDGSCADREPAEHGCYEARLNGVLASRPVQLVCLYDQSTLRPPYAAELLATHPQALIEDLLCDSPHYLPPEVYLCRERELDVRLEAMRARQLKEDNDRRDLDRRAELLRKTFEVIEGERRALAREVHDELGQLLTAIHLRLQAASAAHPGELDDLAELVSGAGAAVQSFTHELRPSLLDDLGLTAALRSFVRRRARDAGIEIEIDAMLEPSALAPAVETACFRIVQEAVTNVVRHAKAQRASVSLIARAKELDVTVRDDGVGFEPELATSAMAAARGRLGLLGMAERAALAGGELAVESSPGRGTVVRARFPLTFSGARAT